MPTEFYSGQSGHTGHFSEGLSLRRVRASLTDQNAAAPVSADCTITGLHYMGDEGGIVCKLDLGASVQNQAFVSITHLRFDPRMPLGRKITAYQKHRVKRLRRQVP